MSRKIRRAIVICALISGTLAKTSPAAEKVNDPWLISSRLGVSSYTGAIGLETQYKHVALTIGAPRAVGVKFYDNPVGHSFFVGAFYMHFGVEYNEIHNGIHYDDYVFTTAGVGVGYRWLWRRRWGLELGIGVGNSKIEYRSASYTDTQKYTNIIPDLTFNYSFQ